MTVGLVRGFLIGKRGAAHLSKNWWLKHIPNISKDLIGVHGTTIDGEPGIGGDSTSHQESPKTLLPSTIFIFLRLLTLRRLLIMLWVGQTHPRAIAMIASLGLGVLLLFVSQRQMKPRYKGSSAMSSSSQRVPSVQPRFSLSVKICKKMSIARISATGSALLSSPEDLNLPGLSQIQYLKTNQNATGLSQI